MPDSSLRAEVLLLVRLAERHVSGCEIDDGGIEISSSVATDAVIEDDGDPGGIEEGFVDYGSSSLVHEFEGALAAAEATDLLSAERAEWLRGLAAGFADQRAANAAFSSFGACFAGSREFSRITASVRPPRRTTPT